MWKNISLALFPRSILFLILYQPTSFPIAPQPWWPCLPWPSTPSTPPRRASSSCAISSWSIKSLARCSWVSMCPTFLLLQPWRALAVPLSFKSKVENGHWPIGTKLQAFCTTSRNPSIFVHKDSKWKRLLTPLLSLKPNNKGQWPESSEAALCNPCSGIPPSQ